MSAYAILADYEGWLHRVAGNLRSMGAADHDDLVQEGRIAMWRAMERYDEIDPATLPGLLTKAAKAAMLDRVTGRRGWTGSEQPGRPLNTDVLDSDRAYFDLVDHDATAYDDVEHTVVTRDLVDRILAALPLRDAVVLLLLDGYGMRSDDVAPLLGVNGSRVRQIRRAIALPEQAAA